MGGELTGRRIPTVVVDLPNQRLLATNMCPRLAFCDTNPIGYYRNCSRRQLTPLFAWRGSRVRSARSGGIPPDRAHELAVLATSTLEGAILLARVRRDLTPLDLVHRQLRNLLLAELPERSR